MASRDFSSAVVYWATGIGIAATILWVVPFIEPAVTGPAAIGELIPLGIGVGVLCLFVLFLVRAIRRRRSR